MATAWSRPNDGDSTFLMFWVKFARVTTLLGGREIAPAAEIEAYLWARRQIKALERGRAAWRGLIGYGLLVVGFFCQLYAAWPRMP
jgi:hypothetical protein